MHREIETCMKAIRLRTLREKFRLLRSSVDGQELVEYALLAGFIAVTVAAVIPYQATGPVSTIFSKVGVYLTSVAGT